MPRPKLLGTYRTPELEYGQRVIDQRRGEVRIIGLSGGRIPWPIGQSFGGRSLALFGDLAEAVRRESTVAICYWFGVGHSAVRKWRRTLGVKPYTEGTRQRHREHGQSAKGRKAIKAMVAKARDPDRRAKISAAKRGKPRPPELAGYLRTAQLGKRHSDTTKEKMRSAHRKRNNKRKAERQRYQPWEDELVRKLTTSEVVARTRRTYTSVWHRRIVLGVADRRPLKRAHRPAPAIPTPPPRGQAKPTTSFGYSHQLSLRPSSACRSKSLRQGGRN